MPRRKQEPQKVESENEVAPSAKKLKGDADESKENHENGTNVNNANGDNGVDENKIVSFKVDLASPKYSHSYTSMNYVTSRVT